MIQSDESIQCRAGLTNELVLSGEMSSEISKLENYVEQHSFPSDLSQEKQEGSVRKDDDCQNEKAAIK